MGSKRRGKKEKGLDEAFRSSTLLYGYTEDPKLPALDEKVLLYLSLLLH